jgi:N-methylhydantoinase B
MAVVRASLVAVAGEIFTVFKRTTLLPILYEVHDFGVSLFDDRLNLIADAPGVPEFVGSLDFALRAILETFDGRDALGPGDVIITTHPFLTGNHPADASMIVPVFLDGSVVGYCGLKAHMGDLGAKDTYPCNSMSMYEEGLLIPPTKLYAAGIRSEVLASLIEANSRMPRETLGDILAGAAALRVGAEKFAGLVARFGHDVYRASVDQLLEQGEHDVRSVIETLADGVYVTEDWLDDNGIEDGTVPLRCTVTISGSDMVVDTTGSADQQPGAFNSTLPMTIAACRLALKRLTTEDRIPSNSGEHRPLTVVAPPRSIFNATPPAATFQMALTAQRLGELVIAALGPAAGGRIPAPSAGDATFMSGVMASDSGGLVFLDGMAPIGYGATATEDGMSALFHFPLAGLKLASAEVTEVRAPLVLLKSELCQDSGGPGKRRGGLGTRLEWITRGEGTATLFAEKLTSPVVVGQDGAEAAPQRNLILVNPGSSEEIRAGKRADARVDAGATIVIQGGSGSGYGDPWEREPDLVAEDVRQGYVSFEAASRSYGVVLDPESLEVDVTETARIRSSRKRT